MTVSEVPTSALLCSDADERVGDGVAGTSTTFNTFVLIEHRGSWSKTAAEDAVRAAMPQDAEEILGISELRPFAIRPIGRARTSSQTQHPSVTHFGRVGADSFLSATVSTTAAQLKTLAAHPGSAAEPMFAVCTNGSRDRCCALKGRPLAQHLHQALSDGDQSPVVEISHLGGHRFASTMIVLPWGYSYGRLTNDDALQIARAAQNGLVHPVGLRGRADLSPAAQAAEIVWRTEIGPAPVDAVNITSETTAHQTSIITASVHGRYRSLRMNYQLGINVDETLCGGKPFRAGRWSAS